MGHLYHHHHLLSNIKEFYEMGLEEYKNQVDVDEYKNQVELWNADF